MYGVCVRFHCVGPFCVLFVCVCVLTVCDALDAFIARYHSPSLTSIIGLSRDIQQLAKVNTPRLATYCWRPNNCSNAYLLCVSRVIAYQYSTLCDNMRHS